MTAPVAQVPPTIRRGYVTVIACVAALGGFLFGLDVCLMGGAILYLTDDFKLGPLAKGFTMTSAMLPCLVAPYLGGWLSDRLGRRKTLALAGLLFAASAAGTAMAGSVTAFNLYRLVGGFGVGVASVISPMYIAEIAPARTRGRLVTLNQLAVVVGATAAILVAYLCATLEGRHALLAQPWRAMFASQLLPVACFMAGLVLVPESPRWLVQRGRDAEAAELLTRIGGEAAATAEMAEIRDSFRQESGGFADLFAPGVRVALLIGVSLALLQQFCGVSAIQAYATVVFQDAGYEEKSAAIGVNVLMRLWDLVCTVAALWLVDRAGRRPLMLVGTVGMAVGLAALGGFFHAGITGIAVPATLVLADAAYLISLAPLTWLIMAEIFPNHLRAKAMGVASMTLWIAAYANNFLFPALTTAFKEHFGSPAGVFWVYSGVCLFAFAFCWRMVPETKGKTLEQIGRSWTGTDGTKPPERASHPSGA